MKITKIIPMTVMVICPNCKEVVSEPKTGSQMWELQDIDESKPYDPCRQKAHAVHPWDEWRSCFR